MDERLDVIFKQGKEIINKLPEFPPRTENRHFTYNWDAAHKCTIKAMSDYRGLVEELYTVVMGKDGTGLNKDTAPQVLGFIDNQKIIIDRERDVCFKRITEKNPG